MMYDASVHQYQQQHVNPAGEVRTARQMGVERRSNREDSTKRAHRKSHRHAVVIDSRMTSVDALAQNPNAEAPQEVVDQQKLLNVTYWSFDGKLHKGQIVVNRRVAQDVKGFFSRALKYRFPIGKVIPAAAEKYAWNDALMMADNNTSGYNYRTVAGSNTLSKHAQGLAIDVNTSLNPYVYVNDDGETVHEPEGSQYNPDKRGTLTKNHPLVSYMKKRGWTWGGDWSLEQDKVIDYQHFEKSLGRVDES